MFHSITRFIKHQTRAIVFVCLILFIVLTYTTSQKENQTATINLLTFSDKVIEDIVGTYTKTSDKTLILENTADNYNEISLDLAKLSSRLANYKIQIPIEKGTTEYLEVTKKLLDVITVSQARADEYQSLYQHYAKNIEDLKNFAKIDSQLLETKTKPEIEKIFTVGLETKDKELIKFTEDAIKAYNKEQNNQEKNLINTFLSLSENNSEAKQKLISDLSSYNNSRFNSFQRIKNDDLQTSQFASSISSLESAIDKLKRKEKLNS
jgi:hypothetical protein